MENKAVAERRPSGTSTAGLVSLFKESATQLNQLSVAEFIEMTLDEKLPSEDLYTALKDGVILCRLINKLRPGTIPRISKRPLPFLQMENISNFLEAAKGFGLKSTDLFQTIDLFEGKDIHRVHVTILCLARVAAGYTVRQPLPQTRDEDVIIEPPAPSHPPNSPPQIRSMFNAGNVNATASPRQSPPTTMNGNMSSSTPKHIRKISSQQGGQQQQQYNTNASTGSTSSSKSSPSTIIGLPPNITPPSTILPMRESLLVAPNGNGSGRNSKNPTPHGSTGKNGSGIMSPSTAPAVNEVLTLNDGETIIQYQLGSCIGRGQFGAVYKALNMETGKFIIGFHM
ncbi:hypothetical protein SmJEL517_g04339 [Synchytrium microbalum]|uniref:Calponin-homology (CH) domain-containing protein n=1 Tax=Synchytrium microbalum TaxID=1806994 RepID=A0A507BZR0_9FUNG|nr:uncharacterized protein SmJEL517_g04339 [Synchytrium microbalum]TPX32598.1 hypothetical protein SmJEL517_g04339 [Synchytrium microbalum]